MKNSLIRKMFIFLFVTVIAVAAGVYGIMYAISYSTIMNDIRQRADGVRDYIVANISSEEIEAISNDDEQWAHYRSHVNDVLNRLRGVGNIKELYIVQIDEHGQLFISTSAASGGTERYVPSGKLADDLLRSLTDQVQIAGSSIYQTEHGSVYSIFWPIMNHRYEVIGVVGMEFDVDAVFISYHHMAIYSFALSGALIVLFSIIAFLSMNKATEPFYKKLAYMDLLTGYENRMSFEQRLREAGAQIDRGKSITLMIFDVNNLKTVNDSMGHKHGDIYLRNTADILAHHIGSVGLLYRIGGDEFATVIVESGKNEGAQVLAAIQAENRPVAKNHLFSCASGAATFDKDIDRTLRDVFARADRAMYDDKRKQKGQPNPPETNDPSENQAPPDH